MSHIIKFDNCYNNWANALPVGNGVFGAMAFYEDGILNIPVNHYEVYYNIDSAVLPEDILKSTPEGDIEKGKLNQQEMLDIAIENQPVGDETFLQYRSDRSQLKNKYSIANLSNTHPVTGELAFNFDERLKDGKSSLSLDIEGARIDFSLEKDEFSVEISIITARCDAIIISVKESHSSLISSVDIKHLTERGARAPKIDFSSDKNTVSYNVCDMLGEKEFKYAGALRLKDAELKAEFCDRKANIKPIPQKNEYELIFSVFTDFRYENLPDYDEIKKFEDTQKLREEHKKYWDEFYKRANISIPDKFLEKLWYVNQYALDSCSGRDGIMKHHACGLNGLWDIRRPTLWGSLWYWDVNIQASFAGVFSSNRLELGKVFSDGLNSYKELAERFAKDVHGLNGVSIDYPYTNYFCVWPWCAQYLWFQYEYSLDKEYLKNDAYPLFIELCRFTIELFHWDEERKCYYVFPDVSPEQGPWSHNTVSTIASVKYMLKFTLESAEILGDNNPILKDIKNLYENLPQYPTCEDTTYGRRMRDSEDALDNLWIRHPGMLMPIFPIGEIDIESDEESRELISNTINYLEDNCEIGVFQCSWISAAASRLGDGQRALRLLYERGIDHLLRSNGLTAEANDRFMNYCLTTRQPLYYPCMMEFTGEMLAAVNEMLLQSQNHIIRVFPAMPDGSCGYDRAHRHGFRFTECMDRYPEYEKWSDVKFTNMLAKGAFEISAELKDGKVKSVEILSHRGNTVRITTPTGFDGFKVFCEGKEIKSIYKDFILSFDTEKGKEYVISKGEEEKIFIADCDDGGILSRTACTGRRIFIGEDEKTATIKEIDDFIRDWYYGNVRMENHTVYKFDITENQNKDYSKSLKRQALTAEPGMCMLFTPFTTIGNEEYTDYIGYGFDGKDIKIKKSDSSDALLSDYATSENDSLFSMDLPRGKYEALFVFGGDDSDTSIKLEGENGYKYEKYLKKGEYSATVIPFRHERDGKASIRVSSEKGKNWKINAVFINMVKGYGF